MEQPPWVHELVYEPFAGLTLVPLEIAGTELDFVLDSGANHSALNDSRLADSLGLQMREAGLAHGMGAGARWVGISGDTELRSRGVELLRLPLAVHDIGDRLAAQAGRALDGLLGWELFERYVVELDPAANRLRLYEPEGFVYHGAGEILKLEVEDRRPLVKARVAVAGGKEIRVRLLVDTGSTRFLTLIEGSKRRLEPPQSAERATSVGVVSESSVVLARVTRLELGSLVAEDLEAAWVKPYRLPAARTIRKLNGVVGNALLRRFHVFFDLQRRRLILEDRVSASVFPNNTSEIPD